MTMHHGSNLMIRITSNTILDDAMAYIYKRRHNDSHNSDIWAFHTSWAMQRNVIREQLLQGRYQLSLVQSFNTPDAGRLTRWSTADAVVLKAFALVLGPLLDNHVDQRCTHLKGRGGLKGACRALSAHLGNFRYVCKSDVASFYDSMNHDIVMQHAKEIINDKRCLDLLYQYLNRVEVLHGDHRLIERGIPKGCPLSPLMGGLLLKSLDDSIMSGCFYVRYMDDWVILTKTRHQLRRVIKKMHQVMDWLKFKLALDKTFIGRISKGFDFLGYRFSHQGIIGLAQKTLSNFKERLSRLYESGASDQRIAQYVRNWMRWCVAGLNSHLPHRE
jgi:RNA-directed DNA polymerase